MFIKQVLLLIFSVQLSLGSENQISTYSYPCPCPQNVPYVSNFNASLVSGAFYLIYGSNNGSSSGCQGCLTVYLSRLSDNTLDINFCCQTCSGLFCGQELGSGTYNTKSLQYTVGCSVSTSILLAVDYSSYFVAYVCSVGPNGTAVTQVFVGSRTPQLDQSTQCAVSAALSQVGIDVTSLEAPAQGSQCDYGFGCGSGTCNCS